MAFAADPPHTHGTLTKFFGVSADFCYKIPDSLHTREGILLEPLAVAVHAIRLADVRPGHRLVVFGAGTVGLFCAVVAREFGASTVISVDLLPGKLDVARKLVGAEVSRSWVPNSSYTAEENAQDLMETYELEDGADIVIDATGAESSVQTAMCILQPGGTYVQVGMGKRNIQFPIAEICERELSVKGSYRYGTGDFELAMSLVQRERIKFDGLITGEFSFEQASEAWESTRRGDGVKNVIKGPGD
ncbi:hypothetical protein JX265_009076 [Neoarthrinium moseri]|uniref:L-arabinitol 4-dehydrogenase n=1 Tax=Neoarthrinium moseri TaxID=1658444 RepID=A0A9Q0AN75_9PEZI|nr:uncharacterized protein JN550_011461 [Neoarthrinium moseri]KAI1860613.1 hypothetical protein JN550_011461 [Neoarthrinium moseri]KAI1863030.1 hypothetical protein JX265_009076 [Neoarthrinium moseri]